MKQNRNLTLALVLLGVASILMLSCGGDDNPAEPPPCFAVNAQTIGTGTIELSPDSSCYHSGTLVTATAVPAAGWEFSGWAGDSVSGVNPLVIQVTDNFDLIASFSELYSLTVQIDPAQGGTVLVTPDQNYYAPGDQVSVEAQPNQFYGFSHWVYEGEVVTDNPTMIIFGQADETILAQFGVLEGEPDCGDGYVDHYNGGCNSSPVVFQDILPDQIILATAGTFDAGTRDTDWYQLEVTDNRVLTFTAVAEFDLQIDLIDGTAGCGGLQILDEVTVPAFDTATVTATVGPGTYWFFAAVYGFTGWPCPQDYKAWLTAQSAIGAVDQTPGRPAEEGELSNVK